MRFKSLDAKNTACASPSPAGYPMRPWSGSPTPMLSMFSAESRLEDSDDGARGDGSLREHV